MGASVQKAGVFNRVVGFKSDTKVLNLIDAIILRNAIKLYIVFKHLQGTFT